MGCLASQTYRQTIKHTRLLCLTLCSPPLLANSRVCPTPASSPTVTAAPSPAEHPPGPPAGWPNASAPPIQPPSAPTVPPYTGVGGLHGPDGKPSSSFHGWWEEKASGAW